MSINTIAIKQLTQPIIMVRALNFTRYTTIRILMAGIAILASHGMQSAHAGDLLSIYTLALQNDHALLAAAAQRDAALQVLPQSVARLLPTINANATADYNHLVTGQSPIDSQQNTDDLFWDSFVSLQLSQPIYRREYWIQLEQADDQVAKAELLYLAEEQKLMIRVAQAYFNALYALDSLQLATAEKEALEHQLKQAQAQFKVGLAAITDVDEAKAAFDRTKAAEITARNELYNAQEAIREITGEYDQQLSALQNSIPMALPQPSDRDAWNQKALEQNIELMVAESGVKIAEKTVDIQLSGHFPTLDLVGNVAITDNNRPTGVVTEAQSIGLKVNVPLYQGGSVNSKVTQARYELIATKENMAKQRRLVTRQIMQAYHGVESAMSQVDAYQAAIASAQSALNAALEGNRVGTRTMVDILLMQSNLYRAKQSYAKARYDYIVHGLSLRQAAGILNQSDFESINQYLTGC